SLPLPLTVLLCAGVNQTGITLPGRVSCLTRITGTLKLCSTSSVLTYTTTGRPLMTCSSLTTCTSSCWPGSRSLNACFSQPLKPSFASCEPFCHFCQLARLG